LDVMATATALERVFGMRSIREREAIIPPIRLAIKPPICYTARIERINSDTARNRINARRCASRLDRLRT
jgi:hypothetical protein